MTYEEWWWDFIAVHEDWRYADSDALRKASFKGGAASRDAEVAELKAELETERRLSFRNQVAELEAERDELKQTCIDHVEIQNALRKQVKMLRDAILKRMASENRWPDYIQKALAATEPKP
jgi:hypothetical protein